MKKSLSFILILMLVLCFSAISVYAYDDNATDIIMLPDEVELSSEDGVPSKAPYAASGSVIPEWIKFIPTWISVTSNQVKVEGYFVNFNHEHSVKTFREFSMDVYVDGRLIVSGDFGTINDFTIEPLGMKFQSFTFNGTHSNHSNGNNNCGDSYYTKTAFRFTSVSR